MGEYASMYYHTVIISRVIILISHPISVPKQTIYVIRSDPRVPDVNYCVRVCISASLRMCTCTMRYIIVYMLVFGQIFSIELSPPHEMTRRRDY